MEIPISQPGSDDIYSLGFDRGLNRFVTFITSPVVYDSMNQTAVESVSFGAVAVGSANTIIVIDPSKGLWLGNASYASAPFRVNMQGDMAASSGAIGGFEIGSNYIRDTGNTFGLTSASSSPFDVRFWAGDTFANRLKAPFIVYGTTGQVWIQGNAGTDRSIQGTTISGSSGISRAAIILANDTAETGSDAGSDFQIQLSNDSGAASFWPITIERKTGNVCISAFGTTLPNAASILEVQSTTKGVRFPNMTTTQRDAIGSPPAGLVIYNTTTAKLNVYTTAWEAITSA